MRGFLLLAGITLIMACKKDKDTTSKAYLKIVHAAQTVTDSIDITLNMQKLNGAKLGFGSVFPVSGVNSYLAVDPATDAVVSITGGSNTNYGFPETFVAGKYYSLILTDDSPYRIFTEDVWPVPDTGTIAIRYIDASTVNDNVYLYSARRGFIALLTPHGISDFAPVVYNSTIKDTLVATKADSTILAKLPLASIPSFSSRRSYTVVLKGNTTLSLTGYVHY